MRQEILLKCHIIVFILIGGSLAQIYAQQSVNLPQNQSQEQQEALKEISQLNSQVVSLFKSGRIDEAFPLAVKCLDIAKKNSLAEDLRVMIASRNLAEIYLYKGKETEAINILTQILGIYEKLALIDDQKSVLQRLSLAYYTKEDYGKSIEISRKYISLLEKNNEADSAEYADAITKLANSYMRVKKFELAEPLYYKAAIINSKDTLGGRERKDNSLWNYFCFVYRKTYLTSGTVTKVASTADFKKYLALKELLTKTDSDRDNSTVDEGVVNGKAIKLLAPNYPETAKRVRAEGYAMVRVTIDESGKVVSARMTCGVLQFKEGVEDAAKKSIFSPFTLHGKPVKITGFILYQFVR